MPSRARNKKTEKAKAAAHAKTLAIVPPSLRPKHLIVDGYNLIHSDPRLKKYLKDFGSDGARDELLKEISILHDYEGWRMTVVFDGRGAMMSVEYPSKVKTLGCVFSPGGISADEVIQGLVEKCVARDDLIVATSDGGIRVFIQTQGARWMTPEELWHWVKEANENVRRAISRPLPSRLRR